MKTTSTGAAKSRGCDCGACRESSAMPALVVQKLRGEFAALRAEGRALMGVDAYDWSYGCHLAEITDGECPTPNDYVMAAAQTVGDWKYEQKKPVRR